MKDFLIFFLSVFVWVVKDMVLLDCTLRDGGYYNGWNFSEVLIRKYLAAAAAVGVNVVELGMRTLTNNGFKGACAFTTEAFVNSLDVPTSLKVAVMVNASELVGSLPQDQVLEQLFPVNAVNSRVDLVRIACHVHEFSAALPASDWLKKKGYRVGFNLMQVADRSEAEIKALAREAADYPLDVLYFADSMGSMTPQQTAQVISWIRSEWHGDLGIHTHDNMGLALSNTLRALGEGATWVDSTVTGMGRGPGNARTEELAIEIAERRGVNINLVPLMSLIRQHFAPMQQKCGWGTNPYYYLTGKYGIHPTYIQEMLNDARYDEEDVLAVIEHLRVEGGKKFSLNTLDAARHFYQGKPDGKWSPYTAFEGQEVLLLGTGPGVEQHGKAIESYIRSHRPLVLALNTQTHIAADLIDFRAACHPVRLLADCEAHTRLPQPLITPYSMLPEDVKEALKDKNLLDYGLKVQSDTFEFHENFCLLPTSLVAAYALALLTSGKARKIAMAGFDGYGADDPRSKEMQSLLDVYQRNEAAIPLESITPTRYNLPVRSVYAL
ncbi:aldolase catalytic domain-containing protein [Marinospirillum alkaliphilum]|uniref:4-hydroxy 2-oxovalerate aldolase n=1 Tax=Marinospirillum alkaliphilum DSM 21637 TaxID=1122209 RepID=A0A1K1U741_9GAMM|nr:aldolase catalytic domain-containing protein [Marinospirillum alkaliphilum]SFX08793.1 4-hydroxy 2-oxovalerate aldolase [Marinospirillum alkaliphilum DSM 21637]